MKAQTLWFTRTVKVVAKGNGGGGRVVTMVKGTLVSGTIQAYALDGIERFDITEASGRILVAVPYQAVKFWEDAE